MSREMKFRAWVASENKMYECGGAIDYILNRFPTNDTKLVDVVNWKRGILMQYTGQKDNKRTKEFPVGQKAYDGDIIEYPYGKRAEVYWHDQYQWSTRTYYKNQHGLHKNFHGSLTDCKFIVPEDHRWIIIGNIHQDKDLLK